MKKLISFLLFSTYFSFSQNYSLHKTAATYSHGIVIAKHTFYETGYNTKYHLPAWTFYSLTREHLQLADLKRKGSFTKDPLLNFIQAKDADYSASGYDKGHMVPCEDMSFSEQAMKETFYYSNCAPQTTELNRGEWKMLEELIRHWGNNYGEVIVISGPVIESDLQLLGEDKIPVPKIFYKIVLRHTGQTYKAIGFLMPNLSSPLQPLLKYCCSVDSVENITGLDFFTDLPDHLENKFESVYNLEDWDLNTHHAKTKNKTNTDPKPNKVPVQCSAKTKKGIRCKKNTTSVNGFCNLHGGK